MKTAGNFTADNIRIIAYQTLTSASTVSMLLATSANATITLGHDVTLTLTGLVSGDNGNIEVIQGAVDHTLILSPTPYVVGSGASTITLKTGVGAKTIISYTYDGTTLFVAYANGVSNSLLLDQTTPQTISNGQPIQDTLTASQLVATGTDKKLVTLSTATYPSLAETINVKGVTSPIQTQFSGKKYYHGVYARPVGAANPLPSNITTTTFTLGATANPITYFYLGTQVVVSSNKTATLDDGLGGTTAGVYYVYFNAATGNILATKAFPGISNISNVLIASVNWNGTDYGLVLDERHSYDRDCAWHEWAHDSIGTRYQSGITLTHNGGTGAAATFAVTLGSIHDEDIDFVVNAQTTGRLFWQTGASTYVYNKVLSAVPGYLGANSRPNVVNLTGYALTQLPSATNRFCNEFVYATNDLSGSIYFFTETVTNTIAGQGGYTSLANARAIPFPNLSVFGLNAELKAIYRLIWRADGVLQAIDTAQDDYRLVSSLPQAAGNITTPQTETIMVACSDLTTLNTATTKVASFHMPFTGTLLQVVSSLDSVATGSTHITDINYDGATCLSTKLSIDDGEYSSLDAATPAVISVSAFAIGKKVSIDRDQVGATSAGKGHVVSLTFLR